MDRRYFLCGVGGVAAAPLWLDAAGGAAAVTPLQETHFPDRLHLFVWRNWELANSERLAEVLRCRPEDVLALGASLGLPRKPHLSGDQLRRLYTTVLRQNWHLLPEDQLMQLLGWSDEKFRFTLKEDDTLDIKLTRKPDCPRLLYAPPGEAARKRAAEIKRLVHERLGRELADEGEPAFAFVQRLSTPDRSPRRDPAARPAGEQIDLTGWTVQAGEGVDPGIARRLSAYLQTVQKADPGRFADRTLLLRLDPKPGAGERFTITVEDRRVEVTGNRVSGLVQGISRLQDEMEENGGPFLHRGRTDRQAAFDPRYLYSHFALYGDPLLEADIDPFPEGFLEKLARVGVNGLWLQAVLNTLAPSRTFPEFGTDWARRLEALNRFVERTGRFGIRLFLYLNEPRAMPPAFFRTRPEMRGAEQLGYHAMCTTHPAVRGWISDSLAHVFKQVPDLGGVFTITMSENLTNCYSRGRPDTCPRCARRKNAGEGVEEVLLALHAGVRRSSKTAEVIVWDWGWRDEMARYLIPRLPRDVRFQSVSEWSLPVERGGVKTRVGEYSISVVGPGPRAGAHWELARQAGLATVAKVQLNNTWELSAVPCIPAAYLVARHCTNLARAGVSGLMESWTLGGYPSPNLEIAREVCFAPQDSVEAVLQRVARRRYGRQAAPLVLEAWRGFSDAFAEFPYGVHIYLIPTQHGPANLLRAKPTGAATGMILFPQDAVKQWSGPYPPAVVRDQFSRMADRWEKALPTLRRAMARVPAARREAAAEDLAIAEVCYLHFRSVANQVAFYLLRDAERTAEVRAHLRELVRQEAELARRLYPLARRHSVLAYEASNHYYYRPLDLAEKIVNCQYLLDHEL